MIILAACFLCMAAVQAQKNFTGIWEGKLDVGVVLRLVFHFDQQPDGSYKATMDSPDQGSNGIPVSKVTVTGNAIVAEIAMIGGKYEGQLSDDTTINGTFKQGPGEFDLQLHKVKTVYRPNRPQTPKPPFTYTIEDVEFDNADKSVHFGGTLTIPQGKGPFAVAILISGSGQQDRDESLMGHQPFWVMADYLTKKGYAVLRVDDRGVGKTTGEVKKASSADFANDVLAEMQYLKTRKEINPAKIGLIGHSEGGLIASLVIGQTKDVAFVISLAGPGMKGADILADQGELMMVKSGMDAGLAQSYNKLYKQIINYSLTEKDSAACFTKVWAAYNEWQATRKIEELDELGFGDETNAKKVLLNLVAELRLPWLQYFNNSDASVNWEKAYCPVLALNGAEDIQVIAKRNLDGIKAGLKKSKSPSYETVELPGLNHLFQHCKQCTVAEYAQIEETFAPEALEKMSSWLKENVR